MPTARTATLVLIGLAMAFAVANIAVTAHRSLIPVALDGTITKMELRHEKHPGVDDVWLVTVGDRLLHVDDEVAFQLHHGATVAKGAWETTLTVDGRQVGLALSPDAVGMLVVMPLAVVVAAGAMMLAQPRVDRTSG
jgi:hypothetical protein